MILIIPPEGVSLQSLLQFIRFRHFSDQKAVKAIISMAQTSPNCRPHPQLGSVFSGEIIPKKSGYNSQEGLSIPVPSYNVPSLLSDL